MARIAGIDLPRDKRIVIGLTYIYGIGGPTAEKLVAEAGINPDTRVRDLTDEEEEKLCLFVVRTPRPTLEPARAKSLHLVSVKSNRGETKWQNQEKRLAFVVKNVRTLKKALLISRAASTILWSPSLT